MSLDPLAHEMPAWSPYSINFNDPIRFIDIDGQVPTPAEAARMALHVYGGSKDNVLIGGWRVSTQDFGIRLEDETGVKSIVYERVVDGKITEYTYATAGTEVNWEDIKADILQPLGLSDQYRSAAKNAVDLSDYLGKDKELTFVGHSLGGGEAALNALITDRRALTFNAAGVGVTTKLSVGGLTTALKSEDKIDAYIMTTDPLDLLQSFPGLPSANGKKHSVSPADPPSVYNGHAIENVIKSIEAQSSPSGAKKFLDKIWDAINPDIPIGSGF